MDVSPEYKGLDLERANDVANATAKLAALEEPRGQVIRATDKVAAVASANLAILQRGET